MYQDHLIIKGFPSEYVLDYSDILEITRFFFLWVRIKHQNPEVPKYVYLWGWALASAMSHAATRISQPLVCNL
jgi:hypothetical protein